MAEHIPIPNDQIPDALLMLEVVDVDLEMIDNQLVGVSLHSIDGQHIFHIQAISLSSRVWGADGLGILEVSSSKPSYEEE